MAVELVEVEAEAVQLKFDHHLYTYQLSDLLSQLLSLFCFLGDVGGESEKSENLEK